MRRPQFGAVRKHDRADHGGRLGVTTVDMGIAALSSHSARELPSTDDPWMLAALVATFLAG
jgi:aspartyl aminopeptidase